MLSVVILAGGLATRIRPVTETIPKSLIEIAGAPFLAHQLRLLAASGIRRVTMCVGHLGEMIQAYAGDGRHFGLEVTYSFDGPCLRGTAGAITHALPLLDDYFFVLYGDSYLLCDYGAVQRAFEQGGKSALMTVYRNHNQWDASNVWFEGGRILAYNKKDRLPQMAHIDYGLGVFRRAVFEGTTAQDLTDVYRNLLALDQLDAYEVSDRFYEIGSFTGISELSAYLHSQEELEH
jgi:NDP-sugar pyrophosphorylase family protein